MQEQSLEVSVCPSFNSYSADRLADTAAEVCREFRDLGLEGSEDVPPPPEFHGDDDFEFASVFNAGDEVSLNGQVGQVFPVFNRDLLLHDDQGGRQADDDDHRRPDDDQPPPSSSSSEADELEQVPAGTYCVWTPKRAVPESPGQCKKSKSTGSSSSPSKRWRLRDLLRRCNSDGKDSFVFLTPVSGSKKMEEKGTNIKEKRSSTSSSSSSSPSGSDTNRKVLAANKIDGGNNKSGKAKATAHEAFYVRNRKMKEGDKRRSFLPYRQDLVGFFANVNAMGRGFPPF